MSIYRGIALTVAGTDSGGGAGVQADLKTFAALKVFGTSAITVITAQNSRGVQAIHDVPPEIITAQLQSVLSDFSVNAVKTGMLSCCESIEAVARAFSDFSVQRLVVDPVMVAQSGDPLVKDDAIHLLTDEILPRALLVTPNVPEAEILSGLTIETVEQMEQAARFIADAGPQAVLVKGGHLPQGDVMVDVLYSTGEITRFESPRIDTKNTHGTGCSLSSAITAELAAGADLRLAVERGRQYLMTALHHSFQPGHGPGPIGHAVEMPWVAQ